MNDRRSRTAPLVITSGDVYGRLTVIGEAPRHRRRDGTSLRMFSVCCDCGTVKTVRLSSLTEGTTVSCGCFHKEMVRSLGKSTATHGQAGTPLHQSWLSMKQRCHNPKDKSYWKYGARGIRVCQEWLDSFEAFSAHVGARPDGHTLDRINFAGNYEPGNVRWATPTQQARNTRRNIWVDIASERVTLAEAVEKNGWHYDTARRSIHRTGKYMEATRVQP